MEKTNCIEWIFDTEDELDGWIFDTEDELDGYNPLGEVRIWGREGSIQEDCTYIDAFLEALIKGFSEISENYKTSVDPIVEPNNVNFEFVDNLLLKVSYGSQTVFIDDFSQIKQSLFEAVQELVEQIDRLTDKNNRERRSLRYLREYLQEAKSTKI